MISAGILCLGAVALLLAHLIYVVFRSGLKEIPGPWLAKTTNLYRVGMIQRGKFSSELVDLHRKYGSAVRIGPDCVSLADRRVAEQIYNIRSSFPKSDWVKSSQTLLRGKVVPALMTTQDQAYHLALKRSIASAYSVTTLSGYEKPVEDTVRFFLERLDELFIKTENACPIDKWLQWYAYDVIGVITMGQKMGFLEQGEDVDGMLHEIKAEADYRAAGAVMPFIDWFWRKNSIMTMFASPTHQIMVRAKKMLQERVARGPVTSHPDFIARFLEAKEKHSDLLNDNNMIGFVGSNLQAGSDTTAIVLRTVVYHIFRNPAMLSRMRRELDAPGVMHPVPFQQAFNELPYVAAVIHEAIRIHPPFALLLERFVPAEGLELPNGTFLPQGTKVGMFGYTMHLDTEVFGEDAEVFNPDRWLQQADEEESQYKERLRLMNSLEMSFGSGQRRCIGVHVAELQVYKLIPALVGLIDVTFVNPEQEWHVEQKFFAVQSNMNVRITWRKNKSLSDLRQDDDS